MKKYLSLICLFIPFIIHVTAAAQQKAAHIDRCGTDLYLQSAYQNYPGYKEAIEKANQLLSREVQQRLTRLNATNEDPQRINASIIIPVVFHIVLPNPDSVTDAEIKLQLDVLNRDFGGQNADSTNLSPMYPYSLRGHSGIRFCMAQKDTRGNMTNGIERRCSNTLATTSTDDPVKRSAAGGLDSWDPNRYFNVWVSNSGIGGLLGYATYPFSFTGYTLPDLAYQGVVITRAGFGNSTTSYALNRGRTLVHEAGHYLGLFHTFEGGCTSQDFTLNTFNGSSNDDTPPQSNPTGSNGSAGCPSGKVSSGCSTAIDSGRLYQNYMDYTDDPCLTMFTVNQSLRMQAAIDIFRPSLITSDFCTPPILFNNNTALVEMQHPYSGLSGIYNGCRLPGVSNIYCTPVAPFSLTPQLKIHNAGVNAIGELDIWYSIDNSAPVFNSKLLFTPALAVASDTLVTVLPISFSSGAHAVKIFTKNPNRAADSRPYNDTLTADIFIDLPSQAPVVEGFESQIFPSPGWNIISSNGNNLTWQRTLRAKNTGLASAFMNLYNFDSPGDDNLVSPGIDIRNADSILVSFERAYKQYSLTPDNFVDSLELLISEDCGSIFKSVWKRGGAQLATNPGPTGFTDWFPSTGDWLPTTIDVKPFVSPGASSLHVGFRVKNGYGQNIFLDDINIRSFVRQKRDAAIRAVTEPTALVCTRTFTPSFLIANAGTDTLKSFSISYSVDGGATNTKLWKGLLAAGQSTTVSFASITLSSAGVHNLLVYSGEPDNLADQNSLNDSLTVRFNVFDPLLAPINEGFENTGFPPANWYVMSSKGSYSWERNTTSSSEGVASAWLRNRKYNGNGARDDIFSPLVQTRDADSVFAKFDIAYAAIKYSSGTPVATDTLEVLVTKDCGRSFTSIYKKWGATLQTTSDSYPYSPTDTTGFVPANPHQWRTDSINLTGIVETSGTFQLAFRNINHNGNNIFLDNIRINQVILPAKLKKEGYLVIPNPSQGWFSVRHYLPPVNLKSIQVFNSGGQLIWQTRYNGNALSTIPINLSQVSAGVYIMRLLYTNKVITQRIIRLNK